MSNNVVPFPNKKSFNDNFKDINGNQYFLVDQPRKIKYLLPQDIEKQEIEEDNNIILPINGDTEFNNYVSNLSQITFEDLEKKQDYFKIQYDRLNKFLSKTELKNLESLAVGEIKEVSKKTMFYLEEWRVKAERNQIISTQFKHVLYNDGNIYFNPDLKNLLDKHVGEEQYTNKDNGFHLVDHLNNIGIKTEIERCDYSLPSKEFKKRFLGKGVKTCTIKLYSFYMIAELCKIFTGKLLNDINAAMRDGKINLNRRIRAGNKNCKWYPNWLIKINGIKYRIAFDFADTGVLQGNISFEENLKNLEMGTDVKNLMDDYKANMLYGLLKHPKEWKKYAIGDLCIYDVYVKYNKLFEKLYEQVNLPHFYIPTRLTVGSTVNDLIEAKLLDYLGYTDRCKATENERKIGIKKSKDFLLSYTEPASPKQIGKYINTCDNNNKLRKKHTGAKVAGGRCFKNKNVIFASGHYTICDIDISSAYTSIASVLDYPFGRPVIMSFEGEAERNNLKASLKDFLKYYRKKFIKRGFKLIVSTDRKNPLKYEQDLFVSFPNLRSKKSYHYDKDGNFTHSEVSVNTENMETAIYTKELHNTPISWDDLNLIETSWPKSQVDDFMDKAKMISAIFYHKDYECNTIKDLQDKIDEHDRKGNGRFKDEMPHSYIYDEDGEMPHYWHKTNFGKLLMDDIIQLRRRNKKVNFSLSYLFKLVGNTIYGNNVSRLFDISNIIFASNITSMCRMAMWCIEKGLDIHQTITDGGVFELNEVLHKYWDKLDVPLLVRAYHQDRRNLHDNKKWKYRPITKNGKKIEYLEGEGWICDDVKYSFDKNKCQKLELNYNKLKSELGEKDQETIKAKNLLEQELEGLNKFLKTINQLALDHVKQQFPKVDLFNGEFEKVKVDDKGLAILDFKGNFIYEKVQGLLEFEVKNICNNSIFHGSANYMYNNTTDNKTIKMRGYESKKEVVAVRLENDKLVYDPNYYNKISATERFLTDLRDNPNNVSIPLPYIKPAILKISEYKNNFDTIWYYSDILPGDTYYKVICVPIYSMRHKFQTHAQHIAWQKYQNSLKRRGGLGFEQFYLNDDGTIRYKDMVEEIDLHIRNGETNPALIFDKNNNFFKTIRYKKNKSKHQVILNHIKLTNTIKNICRIMCLSAKQFIYENQKSETKDKIIMRNKPHYLPSVYNDDFEFIGKYHFDHDFKDKELKLNI